METLSHPILTKIFGKVLITANMEYWATAFSPSISQTYFTSLTQGEIGNILHMESAVRK